MNPTAKPCFPTTSTSGTSSAPNPPPTLPPPSSPTSKPSTFNFRPSLKTPAKRSTGACADLPSTAKRSTGFSPHSSEAIYRRLRRSTIYSKAIYRAQPDLPTITLSHTYRTGTSPPRAAGSWFSPLHDASPKMPYPCAAIA